MSNEIKKEIKWGSDTLVIKTGKVAKQCHGSIMASIGGTVVLATVSSADELKEDVDFFPLSVHYKEMSFAAGKIPGGFIKREGKPSDREVLTSRLIDRGLRPLFKSDFYNETQIICTVLSYDNNHSPDIVAMIAAYFAVGISGLPCENHIAACRVGYINNKYVLNPNTKQLEESQMDFVVAGTESSIMMIESENQELDVETILGAIEFAHENIKTIVEKIEELKTELKKTEVSYTPKEISSQELEDKILEQFSNQIISAFNFQGKLARDKELSKVFHNIVEKFSSQTSSEAEIQKTTLKHAYDNVKSKILRQWALDEKKRVDGRKLDEIRSISSEIAFLPKVHGSALFTRGETQVIAVSTLGTGQDEQIVDGLGGETRDHFLLHYIFPPYSVNETYPLKPPGRREVGHGKLAWRAINPVMPSKESFPYTIRSVSETTESNGSSSMATICGTVLSLMDAGVPIKAPVAGIAMGLIKDGDNFAVLSDISAIEDYLGDMDFKIAGSKNGITALQMDIKVQGINMQVIKAAVLQAVNGVNHILDTMSQTITEPRKNLSEHAPIHKKIQISKSNIKDLIGPGGKVVKEICETCNVTIDIAETGLVSIFGVGQENIQKASDRILSIGYEPEVGGIFDAEVIKVIDIGIVVKFLNNKESLIHISELEVEKDENINDFFKLGDKFKVKFLGIDKRKKIRLEIQDLESKGAESKDLKTKDPEIEGREKKHYNKHQEKNAYEKNGYEKSEYSKDLNKERDKKNNNGEVVLERKYFK